MKKRLIPGIIQSFASVLRHDYDRFALKEDDFDQHVYQAQEINNFFYDLTESGNQVKLVFMSNEIEASELNDFLGEIDFPLLMLRKGEAGMEPVVFWLNKKGLQAQLITEHGAVEADPYALIKNNSFHQNEKNNVVFLTAFPFKSMVSESEGDHEHLSPVKRLLNLLGTEKRDIGYIYIYAVAVGIISLSLPLGTQAIIGFISGGMWFNSVVLLISLVIIGVLVSGGLQIMQISMVEVLQRRVFAKASFEFAYRIPKIKVESLFKFHTPELMNRFFDIVTIQKGLPKLLIDLSTAVLQIFFSLALLSFYHPFFIFFGLLLVSILIVIFYVTGPRGLKSSIVESKYKYKVAFWLEELARAINSFKMAGSTNLPMKRADYFVNNYLKHRKEHFSVLIRQFTYVILFKTFITGGLLILGTLLVIDRQITLGQFVASEIIIVLILTAVEKIIINLDTVYDMLTAVDKIGHVTDLPLEKEGGIKLSPEAFKDGVNIHIKDLTYTFPDRKRPALRQVNLHIKAKEKICIGGFHASGRSTLANIIDGLYQSFDGIITFNQYSIKDLDLTTLRDHIAKNVSQEDIFDGTVLENVIVGKPQSSYETGIQAINDVGLQDEINILPNGLNTELISGGKNLSSSLINKLILARCIAKKPKVIILNDFFQFFDRAEKIRLIRYLTEPQHLWTLIFVSNDPLIMKLCDRIVIMKEGEIIGEGNYEELVNDKFLSEVVANE